MEMIVIIALVLCIVLVMAGIIGVTGGHMATEVVEHVSALKHDVYKCKLLKIGQSAEKTYIVNKFGRSCTFEHPSLEAVTGHELVKFEEGLKEWSDKKREEQIREDIKRELSK